MVKQFLITSPLASRMHESLAEVNVILQELDEIDRMKCPNQASSNSPSSATIYFKGTGPTTTESNLATHFVIKKKMQSVPFICTRTLFLSANHHKTLSVSEMVNENGFLFDYQATTLSESNFANEYKITAYYFKTMCLYFKMIQKFNKNLLFSSLVKFKSILSQKLALVSKKLESKESPLQTETLDIQVNISFLRPNGTSVKIEDYLSDHSPENLNDFNLSNLLRQNTFFTFEISISKISLNNSPDLSSFTIADTFLIFDDKVVNLTGNVEYFEFFETHPHPSKEISLMKDLLAKSLFGNRFLAKSTGIRLKILMSEKLEQLGVHFPFFDVTLSWFQKGFKLTSAKCGNFLLLLSEIQKVSFVKYSSKPLIILWLHQPKFFRKFARNVLIFECSGIVITDLFYPLIDHLKENSVESNFIENLPKDIILNIPKTDYELFRNEFTVNYRRDHQFSGKCFPNTSSIISSNLISYKKKITILIIDDHVGHSLINTFTEQVCTEINGGEVYSLEKFDTHESQSRNLSILNYLTSIFKQTNKQITLKIPHHFYTKNLLQEISDLESVQVDFVFAILDFEKYENSYYCYPPYQQIMQTGFANVVFFIAKITFAETCDLRVFGLNKIFDGEIIFSNGNKNNLTKIVQKEIQFAQYFSSEIQKSKRKQHLYENLPIDFQASCFSFKNPISPLKLANFIEKTFVLQNGIFNESLFEKSNNLNGAKIKPQLSEIEQEIKRLRKMVKPIHKLDTQKGVRITQITGYVRLKDDLSKIYFIDFTPNKQTFDIFIDKIILEEKFFEGQKLKIPVYSNFTLEKLQILVIYKNLKGNLNELFQNALIEVF